MLYSSSLKNLACYVIFTQDLVNVHRCNKWYFTHIQFVISVAGEGEVAVDESLFQDLDDLELEDEFDEDFGDDEGLSD